MAHLHKVREKRCPNSLVWSVESWYELPKGDLIKFWETDL